MLINCSTLVDGEISDPFVRFMETNNIKHYRVQLPANKGKVCMTQDLMVQALGVDLNKANYPLLIHCNKGKVRVCGIPSQGLANISQHRTGCLVACLEKTLGKKMKKIKETYHTYADPKARELDEVFMDEFDERSVLWLARMQGFIADDEPRSAASSPLKTQKQIA